jgi:hypothetical protein
MSWHLGRVFFAASLLLLIVTFPSARAQSRNEATLDAGATVNPGITVVFPTLPPSPIPPVPFFNPNVSFKPSLTLGAEFDHRFLSFEHVAIYGGVDFLASPLDVKQYHPQQFVSREYAYVFLTPHVRVKFKAGPIEPWILVGGGYARFRETAPQTSFVIFHPGTNTGALEVGAGFDTEPVIHLFVPIGFRIAVRDFYSGIPKFGLTAPQDKLHTVALTAGLHLRF